MDKIKWCLQTKNGLELVEPSNNLAEAYLKKAEESLETMRLAKSRDWKISTAYYCLYFSTYSLLIKIGVKCEIHSCTIAFAKNLLTEYLTKEDLELLEDSLQARIDAQYYINREVKDQTYELVIQKAPEFFVKCKEIILKLSQNKIEEIRQKLLEY